MNHRFICVAVSLGLVSCGGGGGGGSSPPPPAPDTIAPNTTLAGAPPAITSSNNATFTFTASEIATFEVRLDGAPFVAATSPHVLTSLAEGAHTFEVRARDTAGNLDATPASATWTVDATPPDTAISAAPSTTAPVNAATFTVTATEPNTVIEASLDGGTFGVITIPHTVAGAADGAHTIRFRARDAAGNLDASPASASFTLDQTPAVAQIRFPTEQFYTDGSTITVSGSASDTNGVGSVSVNGTPAQTTDAYATWTAVVPVPLGNTQLRVRVTDVPGNMRDDADTASMTSRGPMAITPRGLGYDAARDRVIVADQFTGHIYAYRASDGIGQMLSNTNPQGVPASHATPFNDIVIDAANDRALYADGTVDGDTLTAVNLATGARTLLSTAAPANSPLRLDGAIGIALDAASQRVFVAVPLTSSIVAIDLANGNRTIVSGGGVGTGPAMSGPLGLVYDDVTSPASPRLLVGTSTGTPGIMAIDVATGNRSPFSNGSVGTGPSLGVPVSLLLDAPRGRVIAYVPGSNALVGVSLATGNRTLIHDTNTVSGVFPSFSHGLAIKPSTGTLYTAYWPGGVLAIDLATQARTLLVHSDTGTGARVAFPTGLAFEPGAASQQLLYFYGLAGAFYRIDTATGHRQLISFFPGTGTGPTLANGRDFVVDRRPTSNGRSVLVLVGEPNYDLVSVDLATGNRTHVADVTASTLNGNAPTNMALDVAGNRVLYGYNETNSVDIDQMYAIDLTTGANSLVSGNANTGPNFTVPWWMTVAPTNNPTRAIVSNLYDPFILEVSLATGDRALFDSPGTSPGPAYTGTGPLFVDAARSRVLVMATSYPSVLFAKPLAGGARELISGTDATTLAVRGTGPQAHYPSGIVVDSARDIAFVGSSNSASMLAIDLVSGDRILIAR